MNLVNVITVGLGTYVLYLCVKKSWATGKNEGPDKEVQTIRHYEEPSNAQVDVNYHNHDYNRRGPQINAFEPGLYGTTRRVYKTPTNNLQVDDNF